MKIINLILPIMILSVLIPGCSEIKTKPKQWKKARALTERLDHPNALAADEKFIYFVTGGTVSSRNEGTNNVLKIPVEGGEPQLLAENVGEFCVGENEIVFLRWVYSTDMALFKIGKNSEAKTRLDADGYLSSLTIGKSKIYLSDIVKIYELEKYR